MRGCRADLILDFLRHHDAETIYLVGDIIDGWKLRRIWFWRQSHNDVIQKLLRKARDGTRLIYIPGNHDEFMRAFPGRHFGGVEVVNSIVHEAADGRRFLVIHGDQFDVVVRYAPWLSKLGDWAYSAMLAANSVVTRTRRSFGLNHWSLSDWAKRTVKNAVNLIGAYEQALVSEARRHAVDGIICGHIHHAALHDKFGVRYVNTGDWVESCTAVAEHHDGRLEILRWTRAPTSDTLADSEVLPESIVAEAAE